MATGIGNVISSLGGGAGVAGIGLSLIPTALKYLQARKQQKMADAINPIAPDFVANQGLFDNQKIVNDMWNNYTLPGREQIENNLGTSMATNANLISQGSTSGADLLDGITKLSSINSNAISGIGVQEAQMKQSLLPSVLNANAMAGNEAVRRNEFDEARYQSQLAEKAALSGASMQNQYNTVDDVATLGGSLLNYKTQPWTKSPLKNFKQLQFPQ
jgi:hypothetical protein